MSSIIKYCPDEEQHLMIDEMIANPRLRMMVNQYEVYEAAKMAAPLDEKQREMLAELLSNQRLRRLLAYYDDVVDDLDCIARMDGEQFARFAAMWRARRAPMMGVAE